LINKSEEDLTNKSKEDLINKRARKFNK